MKRRFTDFSSSARRVSGLSIIISAFLLSSCTSTTTSLDLGSAQFAPAAFEAADLPVTNDSGQEIAALLPQDGVALDKKPTGTAAFAAAALASAPQGAIVAADLPAAGGAEGGDPASAATLAIASAADGAAGAAGAPQPAVKPVEVASLDAKPEIITDAAAIPAESAAFAQPATSAPKKQKSLFASMFGSRKAETPQKFQKAAPAEQRLALAETVSQKTEGGFALANLDKPLTAVRREIVTEPDGGGNGALPGVRQNALFEIKHRSSASDDSDVDISEEDSAPIQVAYAAGLARLTPNGLKVQRESVDVACLKPQLVKVLKGVERHYGREVVVTSGFRSPSFNRRVRGAKNSLHMYCAAADIQVSGVSKWALAQYLRSLPGRGGVGTYCHTDSIHVDIGPDRDWNWRCSRGKRRK